LLDVRNLTILAIHLIATVTKLLLSGGRSPQALGGVAF
jgi:hypothetical protein